MTRLDLSKNQIKFLNEDFCNLTNLRHLDLYNNQLENLPVQFGRLNKVCEYCSFCLVNSLIFLSILKLRYLDLKGNPLVPTLAKIVGPCLTSKDCMEAAKNALPFMVDSEIKFEIEKKKQEAVEAKRKEEELNLIKEQVRLAKKAARKERITRERQEKAEDEKISQEEEENSEILEVKHEKEAIKITKIQSESRNILSFLRTFVSVIIFVALFSVVFVKFLPDQSNKVLSLLPRAQQDLFRYTIDKIDRSIFGVFQKVINLYKM